MTIFKKEYFFSFYVVSFMESDDKLFSHSNRFSLCIIIKEKENVNFSIAMFFCSATEKSILV